MRKILKGDGLSSCDFVAINAQSEPAEFKNQPKKLSQPINIKRENYEFFTLQPSGYK
ncbi:MAG: hypothetical protein SPI08_03525 [Campylobacter sp.]|nr:hypothetical protein [Campylobacter sp.]